MAPQAGGLLGVWHHKQGVYWVPGTCMGGVYSLFAPYLYRKFESHHFLR